MPTADSLSEGAGLIAGVSAVFLIDQLLRSCRLQQPGKIVGAFVTAESRASTVKPRCRGASISKERGITIASSPVSYLHVTWTTLLDSFGTALVPLVEVMSLVHLPHWQSQFEYVTILKMRLNHLLKGQLDAGSSGWSHNSADTLIILLTLFRFGLATPTPTNMVASMSVLIIMLNVCFVF